VSEATAPSPRRTTTQGLAAAQSTDPRPTHHSASAAASNHYESLDMSRVQRPTSDEYLTPDPRDYVASQQGGAGFKVVYRK